MRPGKGAEPREPAVSGPMGWAGPAVPDHRLASLFTRRSSAPAKASAIGILDTHPPTSYAAAGFTASLAAALIAAAPGVSVGVVQFGQPDTQPDKQSQELGDSAELKFETVSDPGAAARALNGHHLVIVQYEDGIAGRADDSHVADVLERLHVPVVLVVHTVPAKPTAHQRSTLEALIRSADAMVTMSRSGRVRLLDDYGVEPRRLLLIPHGAPGVSARPNVSPHGRRPMILTWGMLGPGKGIEWGIDALSVMSLMRPRPRYVVAGAVHPHLSAEEGAHYQEFLQQRAKVKGVEHLVEFEFGFVAPQRLHELLIEADVVLVPYDSDDQVTSGVLAHAMAARVPVVSTAFPHATELLGDARGGTVVPQRDSASIAAALTRIIVEPGVAGAMSAHNANFTGLVSWPTIASHYHQLFDALMRPKSATGR